MAESCSTRSGDSVAARALVADPCPEPEFPLLLVLAVHIDHDRLHVLARHPKVPLALVELPGGLVAHRPRVGLRTTLRLLILAHGFDPEDVLTHPLLHGRQLVPAEPHQLHPPAKVLALVHVGTRPHRELAAGVQVEPDEVEGALPFHWPGRAP